VYSFDDIQQITSYPLLDRQPNEPLRTFLARRRSRSYEDQQMFRHVLLKHFSHVVPSSVYENSVLASSGEALLQQLRMLCREHDGDSLGSFERDFSDSPGEDPFFYDSQVLLPAQPLSGLVRIPGFLVAPQPTLISIAKPPIDCALSANLVLHASEYYARYFLIDASYERNPIVPYSITTDFPEAIWSLTGTIISIMEETMDLNSPELVRTDRKAHLNVWLTRLGRDAFDHVLATADAWRFEVLSWKDCPGIGTLMLFHHTLKASWCVNLCGAALQIYAEEAALSLQHLLGGKAAEDDSIQTRNVIVSLLPFLSPGEGVPLTD
jgi:hypothetical protein